MTGADGNGQDVPARRALRRCGLAEAEPEEAFGRLARIAAASFSAPMAAVTVLDGGRRRLHARSGLDRAATAWESALCARTMAEGVALAVPDTLADPAAAADPLVAGPPHVRAYLGVPLPAGEATVPGVLCVLDTVPRPDFARKRAPLLADLAAVVAREMALRAAAGTDELTGLASRRHFLDELARETARARRHGRPLSVGFADLDDFKRVNDVHGHGAGDAVLRQVARRLEGAVRAQDLVGRLGGEEFGLLLPDTPRQAATALAERLAALIRARPVESPAGPVPITLSIGLASAAGAEADGDSLLRRADLQLYRAKAAGRDRVAIARPGVPPPRPPERCAAL
jgi:diguanylate cyclase (GGDEF)-like protein